MVAAAGSTNVLSVEETVSRRRKRPEPYIPDPNIAIALAELERTGGSVYIPATPYQRAEYLERMSRENPTHYIQHLLAEGRITQEQAAEMTRDARTARKLATKKRRTKVER